jgi:4'-phosphopantetheinyl transferase
VDVEKLRPVGESARIVARYFTPREQAEFLAHAEPERTAAFFRGWTRKEAFLKATGTGIAAGLDSFEVTLAPDLAALVRVGDDPSAADRWTLRDLDAEPGYAAAVAVEGLISGIILRDWYE